MNLAKPVCSKNLSYGVWMPMLSRTRVTLAKGILFNTMGHSALRPSEDSKLSRRLELLPEEALYLVERGTMSCLRELPDGTEVPMSSQQAFAEMIGCDELTLEKYHVRQLCRSSDHS
jgi:tRNA-splicing endonuclease subunit Sen54